MTDKKSDNHKNEQPVLPSSDQEVVVRLETPAADCATVTEPASLPFTVEPSVAVTFAELAQRDGALRLLTEAIKSTAPQPWADEPHRGARRLRRARDQPEPP